jgi:predicted MPP superfamily phosphohydrolase
MWNNQRIVTLAMAYMRGLTRPQIGVIVFIGVVLLACFAWSGWILVSGLVNRFTHRPPQSRGPWNRWGRRGALFITLFTLLCFAYSFYEPYRLDVTYTEIPCAKLPAGTQPIRIVHISDIHSTGITRLEDDLPTVIAAQHPDIICFTGDALSDADGLETFRTLINHLAQIAPVYGVRGNWEGKPQFARLRPFSETSMIDISGRAERITIRGQDLWIAGMPYGTNRTEAILSRIDTSLPVIYLNHVPSAILDLGGSGVDLCLAGHTHGGQVALPGYGALITLTNTGKRFERGLYEHEGTYLYVTRGIGMEGSLPPIRFFALPEVSVIDLVPAQ